MRNQTVDTKKSMRIVLDPELHRQLKFIAAREETTMANIVTTAIKNQLNIMNM